MDSRRSRRRSWSLRARITLAATAIVGAALAVGALVFFLLLRGALVSEVRAVLEGDIDQIEAQLDGAAPAELEVSNDDDRIFQVLSAAGEVVAASDSAPDDPVALPPSDEGRVLLVPGEEDEYLVLAEALDEGGTIVAGRTLEDVNDALATVSVLLAGSIPLLVLLVAVSSWLVIGRALAPVDRMRRQVDEVSASRLDRRIADPGRSDELGRLAHTMNNMLDRLEQSQRSQRQFVSNASHELRSPLASLRQYAEVARSHPDRLDTTELAEAVLAEGGRLERLVQAMLVLARADERGLEAAGDEVDLDDLLLSEVRRLRNSTDLQVDGSRIGPARVRGSDRLLEQVVRNLGDNATRHAAAAVALSLQTEHEWAVLAVDDDGQGVPSEAQERIFERFVRLDEARARDSGGSGLGLAIVRELVHAHGGDVQVGRSNLGGARFEVRLPSAP